MIRKLVYTFFAIAFSIVSFSQTNNELMKLGDAAMVNGNYTNAVYYYAFILYKVKQGEEANYYPYEITTTYKSPKTTEGGAILPPGNPSGKEQKLIHKLAFAYLQADDYTNSKTWYESAIKHPDTEFPNSRYYYGVSLMYNERFEEAKQEFITFQEEIGDEQNKYYKMAESQIASCQFALNPANTDEQIDVAKVDGNLTEGNTNFGVQFTSDDHIIFSSSRKSAASDSVKSSLDGYQLDLYIAPVNEDKSIGTPVKFPFAINAADYHEGSAVLSQDGNTIMFTKMDPTNRIETKIYGSRKFNGRWLEPFELGNNVNQDGFRSMSPFLSADGETLYFSSNRPGGEGGMDIWSTKVSPSGETSTPVNLGTNVNTPSDEISPFFHAISGTLYYSSSGHIGFGGQDIFYSKWNEEEAYFSQTKNAGAPINSSYDDSYFVIDDMLENGYVTSDRQECSSCDSIYNLSVHCNQLYRIKKPELEFAINGFVFDKATNEIIPNAKVEFKDVDYKWDHFEVRTDENGYYESKLIPNLELFMRASQIDYFADKAIISTVGELESKTYQQNFYLEKIPKGEITIEGIEYDFDKATLRPASKVILDNLVEFLELNDNLIIEIRSHTDIRGNDDYNMDLSERRAKSVVDYLIEHGIPMERLKPKGYGETLPAEIPDAEGNITVMTPEYIESLPTRAEKEEAHQRNRRTAFFVLEQK